MKDDVEEKDDDDDVEGKDELIEESSKMDLLVKNETILEHFDRKKEKKKNCWNDFDCKSFDLNCVSFVD